MILEEKNKRGGMPRMRGDDKSIGILLDMY